MSARSHTLAGRCAPWSPIEDKALEPFIWMQQEAPRQGGPRAPSRSGARAAAPAEAEQTQRITTGGHP